MGVEEEETTTTADVVLAEAVDDVKDEAELAQITADTALAVAQDAINIAQTAPVVAVDDVVDEVVATAPEHGERLAALEATLALHLEQCNTTPVAPVVEPVVEDEGPEIVEVETSASPEEDTPEEETKTETKSETKTEKEGSKNAGGKSNGGRRFRRGK